ncbi:hypothetical protein [Variovorax sp. dw_954]|uniref:hypothetical protein n=1 Tax=Variovorax sp. dw_954 TaxID=2720078 RepID=UPI001BD345DA|nr:hypothetical protein [Variovorax sp. dw_954]
MTDAEKHSARLAEARRRIALASALDESAVTRADGDAALILAGARAHFWLVAGVDRSASERFIADLLNDFGAETVLRAAIAMCQAQPLGPKAWLRQACRT